MFLESIKQKNQYPIIFVGSGITRRYYANALTWEELLKELWEDLGFDISKYYAKYSDLEPEYGKDSFNALTNIASYLEKEYHSKFFHGDIIIPNLSVEQAHNENISPFKMAIANKMNNLELREEYSIKGSKRKEYDELKTLFSKARMIVTTNYDPLIENLLDQNIKINIGNKGLFKSTNNFGELFKIHGSSSEPNSIIITAEDYKNAEHTSALINARILSSLVDSPILFIGYSLTDENIKNLLRDFSDNLPFSINDAADLIGVLYWEKGVQQINESIFQTEEPAISYTQIRTDNYERVYHLTNSINQGISPHEISKYQNAFRKIIEVKGREGTLDTVLTSFVELDNLSDPLKSSNLVVAFGDSRLIYKVPEYIDYIKAYFLPGQSFPVELALKYIMKFPVNTTIPITKVIRNANLGFDQSQFRNIPKMVSRIESRNIKFPDISSINGITPGKVNSLEIKESLPNATPKEIYTSLSMTVNPRNRILFIIDNISTFSIESLNEFTDYLLNNLGGQLLEKTEYRKFFLAFSFILDPEIIQLNAK